MQIILKEHLAGYGKPGDIITVKKGFARNYLIPNGKAIAILNTPDSRHAIEEFQRNIGIHIEQVEQKLMRAQQAYDSINKQEFYIARKCSAKGFLFGAVTNDQLAKLVEEKTGQMIDKNCFKINPTDLKQINSYNIQVKLATDLHAQITLHITRDQS